MNNDYLCSSLIMENSNHLYLSMQSRDDKYFFFHLCDKLFFEKFTFHNKQSDFSQTHYFAVVWHSFKEVQPMASCLIKMKYTRVIFGLCCSLALTFSKIGLTNPGNLCYLNSVIQSLYHVEDFRQRILALKSVEDLPVANAMKNLFWELTVKAKGMSM